MANKVGSIMTYSGGTSYEVGDIYDGKIAKVADNNALIMARFNENGVVDQCGNEWQIINKNPTNYPTSSLFNTENSKYDYAFHLTDKIDTAYAEAEVAINLWGKNFTIECWYYPEFLNVANNGNQIFSLFSRSTYGYPSMHLAILNCATDSTYTDAYPWIQFIFRNGSAYNKLGGENVSSTEKLFNLENFFNRYNHIAVSYRHSSKVATLFVNGQPIKSSTMGIFTSTNAASMNFIRACIGYSYIYKSGNAGNNAFPPYGGSISEVILRENFVYPETGFSIPSAPFQLEESIQGNIPIRHNNATYYAPLISDANYKSSPCIAVRHNNQTYYTVK